MEMMNKIGGRKFLMALLVVGAAMFLELRSARGLTVEMAGFLVAVLGAFSAANYATTAKHMDSKNQPRDGGVHEKLDQVTETSAQVGAQLEVVNQTMQAGLANPETLNTLLSLLDTMKTDIQAVKATTGQIGQTVVNLSKR